MSSCARKSRLKWESSFLEVLAKGSCLKAIPEKAEKLLGLLCILRRLESSSMVILGWEGWWVLERGGVLFGDDMRESLRSGCWMLFGVRE